MPNVSIQQNGKTQTVTIGRGKPLLMALEGVQSALIPVGCRGGGCGVCRVHIVSGDYESKKMSRAHISEADEKKGVVLACRVIPRSDLVITLATPTVIAEQQRKTQVVNRNNK